MYSNLEAPEPFLKPFPAVEEVFAEPLELHRKHFLPLVSVDVSVVHPDLDLWLHFVTPIEPLLELDVGTFTENYHDVYNHEGQYALKLADGKYAFTGDFNYFAYESGAIFQEFDGQEEEIEEDRRLRIESYELQRKQFGQWQRMPSRMGALFNPAEDPCAPFVKNLGGDPSRGNWPDPPVNQSGVPFRYIGEVAGWSYCEGGIQAIMLFYDRNEEIALFRTDFT